MRELTAKAADQQRTKACSAEIYMAPQNATNNEESNNDTSAPSFNRKKRDTQNIITILQSLTVLKGLLETTSREGEKT